MPKALKKYKNVTDFLKAASSIEKDLEKKYKLPAKDVKRFAKVMSDKNGIEKTYMALVEEEPKLLKIAGDVEKVKKVIDNLSKAQDKFTAADKSLVQVSKALKQMVDGVGGDRKQLAGDAGYNKLKAFFEKATGEWANANKQVKQRDQATKQLVTLQDSYTKEKDKAAKTYGVTLKTDDKSLVVIMGKSPEVSIVLGG
ncbi:hypothetical protein [Pseudovibrio sp. Tun.PSC04-5.I4]|uniref:hypothetical protein n=1 Tax=Pseudovibrio sp. Tun.PSC04-5.I4 TaxID=1798213 RepID=UPI0008832EB3|nr:hypothetical protein [Pseudovibrio sp. Tun.PSC04-5.I4]SDR03915.1 hypothetical protein SAMN04515695_2447 [Pseudovibrio sp. Tun.PSC04-5.I4]